jgi:ribosome biogenesis protein NSA1
MGIRVSQTVGPALQPSLDLSWHQGISGAVNSIAPAPSVLASTALDRFSRIHSTYPPPAPGAQLERKGEVLSKVFMNSIPTVVRWDQDMPTKSTSQGDQVADSEDDEIWDTLKHVQ